MACGVTSWTVLSAGRSRPDTVLRSFYGFHLGAGTGPVINPFPLDRSRRHGRAHAHHNPMEPYRNERSGLYRPKVPSRVPRSIPDGEFNEIFARLPSHRDRALVAFYVSTGARASELLSATVAGTDPGRQVITVVRKGTRELQELPASTDASSGCGSTRLRWTDWSRRGGGSPCGGLCGGRSAAVLPRRPPDVRAGERAGRDLCHAPFLEAHCGLQDGGGFLAPADRCPVCPWPCPVDHYADLPDSPQGGGHPAGAGHHAEQTRQAAARSRPSPAQGYRPETLDVLFRNGAS